MTLRIFRLEGTQATKSMDIALDPNTHRTGDIWHCQLRNLKRTQHMAYAWLAHGTIGWSGATRFAPGSPLLDPYATSVRPVQMPKAEQGGRTVLAGAIAAPQVRRGCLTAQRFGCCYRSRTKSLRTAEHVKLAGTYTRTALLTAFTHP